MLTCLLLLTQAPMAAYFSFSHVSGPTAVMNALHTELSAAQAAVSRANIL